MLINTATDGGCGEIFNFVILDVFHILYKLFGLKIQFVCYISCVAAKNQFALFSALLSLSLLLLLLLILLIF